MRQFLTYTVELTIIWNYKNDIFLDFMDVCKRRRIAHKIYIKSSGFIQFAKSTKIKFVPAILQN